MLRSRLRDFDLEQNRDIFWDCKNDIGARRTYHKAPGGFQSAKAIGGHLLKYLMDAALTEDRTPVTTSWSQRPLLFRLRRGQDTVEAARLSDIEMLEGGLLDEPIAAFVAYLVAHGKQAFAEVSAPQRLVVFDFGGGTCDVAFSSFCSETRETGQNRAPHRLPIPPSWWRGYRQGYCRRGSAPAMNEQDGLNSRELDYGEKSDCVIPALLGISESLKIGLCQEITRLKRFDRYDEEHATLIKKNPGVYPCALRDGTVLRLQSPTLSAVQLDKVLKPFLDEDLLYARETDYHMSCSIFAPLRDALHRAGVESEDVDLCLMVGGSSLVPQIAEAVEGFFGKARFLRFEDLEQTQTAIAQGAACKHYRWACTDRASFTLSRATASTSRLQEARRS